MYVRSILGALMVVLAGCQTNQQPETKSESKTQPERENHSDTQKLTVPSDLAIEARTLIRLLETAHFHQPNDSRATFETVIDDFMVDLDPQHLFLLDSDRLDLSRKFGDGIYAQLTSTGDLAAAIGIFEAYRIRVQDRVEWISNELKQDYIFSGVETYTCDRSVASWPRDAQAADELWRRRLQHELLAELLNAKDIGQAKTIVRDRYYSLLAQNVAMDGSYIISRFLAIVAQSFDSLSTYFSPQMVSDFSSANMVGIGLLFKATAEGCMVSGIVPGGASQTEGGIEVGDIILSVGQEGGPAVDIYGFDSSQIVSLLRGKRGSLVRLTIKPARSLDPSERRDIILHRSGVPADASKAYADIIKIPSNGKTVSVGVVHLLTFYGPTNGENSPPQGSASSDVDALLADLQQQNVEGVVLDLRGNTGGFLDEAVEVAGLFLGPRLIARVKGQKGSAIDAISKGIKKPFAGPLAVLVDRTTASGAEIVVGALQNYGRAVIVGSDQTFGAGTVQRIFELRQYIPNNRAEAGVAKITTDMFFLPNGISTQQRGIVPDIILPSLPDAKCARELERRHAMPWVKNSVSFDGQPLPETQLARLRKFSNQRQAELEEFSFLREVIRELDPIKTAEASLNLNVRRQKIQEATAMWDRLRGKAQGLASGGYPISPISLNSTEQSVNADSKVGNLYPQSAIKRPMTVALNGASDVHLRETLRILADLIQTN